MEHFFDFLLAFWNVLAQMAPYLLFGFLMAGLLSAFLSPRWVERHLGGHGLVPVAKASLFGAPLPLCSCSVIPVTASLRRHGASRGATTSFLLSAPQTGVDSILATYAILGPVYAVARPVVALLTGFVGGAAVSAAYAGGRDSAAPNGNADESCCGCEDEEQGESKWLAGLRYGLRILPADLARPLLIGLAAAALISALVTPGALEPYLGGGPLAMLIMMVAGVPIYVCATASIPLAVGFIHMGASPGAALAFLITGPATNAATISVLWKVLGRKTALIYLATILITAPLAGVALDLVYGVLPIAGPQMAGPEHEMTTWLHHAAAAALLAVMAYALFAGKLPWVARRRSD